MSDIVGLTKDEVLAQADVLETCRTKVEGLISEINKVNVAIQNGWQGAGAEQFLVAGDGSISNLEALYDVIVFFKQWAEDVADQYAMLDTELASMYNV